MYKPFQSPLWINKLFGDHFTPFSVPGLVGYFDPNDPDTTFSSGDLVSMPDLTGNGHTMDNTVGGMPSSVTVNGRTWLDYDGTEDVYSVTTPITGQPWTILAAFSCTDTTNIQQVAGAADSSTFNSQLAGLLRGNLSPDELLGVWRRDSTTNAVEPSTIAGFQSGVRHWGMWQAESDTRCRVRLDNSAATEGFATVTDIQPTGIDTFAIGAEIDINPAFRITGRIGLVLAYNQAISTENMALLYQWAQDNNLVP